MASAHTRNGKEGSPFAARQRKVEHILRLLNELPTYCQAEVANRIFAGTIIGYRLVHDGSWRRALAALPQSAWVDVLKSAGTSKR